MGLPAIHLANINGKSVIHRPSTELLGSVPANLYEAISFRNPNTCPVHRPFTISTAVWDSPSDLLRTICLYATQRAPLIILPMAVVPMVVAVVFRTQTGAALIAFAGFVALFVVTYRWALRRAGRAENRISRKLKQS